MKKQVISEAIGNIDGKYIVEATEYKAESKIVRHNIWKKITAVAACIIFVSVLGSVLFQSGLFDDDSKIETPNGNVIEFQEIYEDLTIVVDEEPDWFVPRILTENESKLLFNDLPISAYGKFNTKDDNVLVKAYGELYDIGFEVSNFSTMFQYVFDEKTAAEINGVYVTARCFRFVDGLEQNKIIYYAAFEVGDKYYYLDECVSANNKKVMKKARKNIANAIEALINNGEIDFSKVKR